MATNPRFILYTSIISISLILICVCLTTNHWMQWKDMVIKGIGVSMHSGLFENCVKYEVNHTDVCKSGTGNKETGWKKAVQAMMIISVGVTTLATVTSICLLIAPSVEKKRHIMQLKGLSTIAALTSIIGLGLFTIKSKALSHANWQFAVGLPEHPTYGFSYYLGIASSLLSLTSILALFIKMSDTQPVVHKFTTRRQLHVTQRTTGHEMDASVINIGVDEPPPAYDDLYP